MESARHFFGDSQRERHAILTALLGPRFLDPLWERLGEGAPWWIGMSLEFKKLLGPARRQLGLEGDVDILAIPVKGNEPDFDRMCAVEVKSIPLDSKNRLSMWGRLEDAERQAAKLARLGFRKVAVLHILHPQLETTSNFEGSSGWWHASDRAWDAYDAFRKATADRAWSYPTFAWPWSPHPNKDEMSAGAGGVLFAGGPATEVSAFSADIRGRIVSRLRKMVQSLPRAMTPHPYLQPNVFGPCRTCRGLAQHFWDHTFCRSCPPVKTKEYL